MALFNKDLCIKTVEMHTGGEPLRIIVSGYPKLVGDTLPEQRLYISKHLDNYRKVLMEEPRGHYDMYGALLVTPTMPEADLAVLFMHNEGYSTMCGHGVLALARYAVDYGIVKAPTVPETKVTIQCPCGLVPTYVQFDGNKTGSSRFVSVPAFVYAKGIELKTKNYGSVQIDISYGGAFYAIISDQQVGLDVHNSSVQQIVAVAGEITDAVKEQVQIDYRETERMNFIYGTIITDSNDVYSEKPTANVCVFADKQVDRSPCGSGVTARLALQFDRGQIGLNQSRQFQCSKTGSVFLGRVVTETTVGDRKAVQVEVTGNSFYLGTSTFTLEAEDKLGRGFFVR